MPNETAYTKCFVKAIFLRYLIREKGLTNNYFLRIN